MKKISIKYKNKVVMNFIAVSQEELGKFGCPYCGYRSGFMHISGGGSGVWKCGDYENCGKDSCILAEGKTRSNIGFSTENKTIYPKLQDHPRRGIPSHGRPDKQPITGGEFFNSRGIGLDNTPGCFICGGKKDIYNNIAAFVQCKEAGERILNMFSCGARLDYREFEPDRVQVKIGACKKHLENLKKLDDSTKGSGIITEDGIKEAKK